MLHQCFEGCEFFGVTVRATWRYGTAVCFVHIRRARFRERSDASNLLLRHRAHCDGRRCVKTAQAADATLTLVCKGIETSQWGSGPKSSEKVNIGIIVDLPEKTVTGLEPTSPLTIDDLTETTISFSGMQGSWDNKGPAWNMSGILDRITGSLVASSSRYKDQKNTVSFDLKCKPAQRMF